MNTQSSTVPSRGFSTVSPKWVPLRFRYQLASSGLISLRLM